MKKHIKQLLIICLMLLLVVPVASGCAGKNEKEVSESDDDDRDEDDKQDSEKKKRKKKKKKENNEPEEEPPVEEVSGVFADAFRNGEVENNGNWYVRVEDRVYYRIFNTRGLERTTIMGSCIAEVPENLTSELRCYDLNSGQTDTVCETTGTGKLFALSEGFVLADPVSYITILVPVDGSDSREYADGIPKAVSDDGRYLITTSYPTGADTCHIIYHDGVKTGQINEDQADHIDIYGFSGDNLITMNCDYSNDTYTLCSYDEQGDCTRLGDMKDVFDEIYGYPELGMMVTDKNDLYLTVGFYDGTGHFLQGWELLRATPGKDGTLERVDTTGTTAVDEFTMPKFYLDDSGEVKFSAHLKGDIALSEGTYGDLVYYEAPDKIKTLRKNYIYEHTDYSYGSDFLQDAVVFDNDKVFLIKAGTVRDELSDIGWRPAYTLMSLDFIEFSFSDDNLDEDGLVKELNYLEYEYSGGWNKGDFKYEDVEGTWTLYAYETEGDFEYADSDSNKEQLILNSDKTMSYVRYKNDGVSIEKEITLFLTDPESEDLRFCYETEEGADEKLQIVLMALDEGRLDADITFYYSDGTPGGYYGIYTSEEFSE